MNLLASNMCYLLFVCSIEENKTTESNNYSDLSVKNYVQEDEKDFNYNDLSIEEISSKKMPYINCNRKVFCNSNVDLVDLLISKDINYLPMETIDERDEFVLKLSFVRDAIYRLVFRKIIVNTKSNMFRKYSIMVKKLDKEIERLENIMMNNTLLDKVYAYKFLIETENFIGEISNINIFELFFGLRPSAYFDKIFIEKDIKASEFKQFMEGIYIIYKRVIKYIMNLDLGHFRMERNEYYIPSSYFLKESILLKWMLEVEKIYVLNSANNLERINHMLVYSINANDVLIGELSNIIQKMMDAKTDKELKLFGLEKMPASSSMNNSKNFGCYNFELSNKKSYVIRIFDLEDLYRLLPLGFLLLI